MKKIKSTVAIALVIMVAVAFSPVIMASDGSAFAAEKKSIKKCKIAEMHYYVCYTGKVKKPKLVVKDGKKVLAEKKDYTVKRPKNAINVGDYVLYVTGKGKYTGVKKTTFSIYPPKKKFSVKTSKTKLLVEWSKFNKAGRKQITKLRVACSPSLDFPSSKTKEIQVKPTQNKVLFKNLKRKTKYYVMIYAEKEIKHGDTWDTSLINWGYKTIKTK